MQGEIEKVKGWGGSEDLDTMFQGVWSHRDFQLGRDMAKCRPEKNNHYVL